MIAFDAISARTAELKNDSVVSEVAVRRRGRWEGGPGPSVAVG